ncbi:hypothetical protein WJX73_008367 [Symbiochloris irregularis]|uniref:Secreted protein n=1 Tax=Symbiochloris irregularis TaxID=706552 RepID=A0AAW1NVC1_9CHLO
MPVNKAAGFLVVVLCSGVLCRARSLAGPPPPKITKNVTTHHLLPAPPPPSASTTQLQARASFDSENWAKATPTVFIWQ